MIEQTQQLGKPRLQLIPFSFSIDPIDASIDTQQQS